MGSLTPLFEKPTPGRPPSIFGTIIKPPDQPAFTEIFSELHFKEKPDLADGPCRKNSTNFTLHNFQAHVLESLQLCTEGLGSESLDDSTSESSGEDLEGRFEPDPLSKRVAGDMDYSGRRNRSMRRFPPPISSIGSNGKPIIVFESFKDDGRFVLKEVRVQTQEVLHACREDGRLKLHFVKTEEDMEEDDGGGGGEEGKDGRDECEERC